MTESSKKQKVAAHQPSAAELDAETDVEKMWERSPYPPVIREAVAREYISDWHFLGSARRGTEWLPALRVGLMYLWGRVIDAALTLPDADPEQYYERYGGLRVSVACGDMEGWKKFLSDNESPTVCLQSRHEHLDDRSVLLSIRSSDPKVLAARIAAATGRLAILQEAVEYLGTDDWFDPPCYNQMTCNVAQSGHLPVLRFLLHHFTRTETVPSVVRRLLPEAQGDCLWWILRQSQLYPTFRPFHISVLATWRLWRALRRIASIPICQDADHHKKPERRRKTKYQIDVRSRRLSDSGCAIILGCTKEGDRSLFQGLDMSGNVRFGDYAVKIICMTGGKLTQNWVTGPWLRLPQMSTRAINALAIRGYVSPWKTRGIIAPFPSLVTIVSWFIADWIKGERFCIVCLRSIQVVRYPCAVFSRCYRCYKEYIREGKDDFVN